MSLPGIVILTEKLSPKILGRLGKENPSKRRCKVAFVRRKFGVTSSVSVRFLYAAYKSKAKISVCMLGSGVCCPICVLIPELFVWIFKVVLYVAKCGVTSHDTATGLLVTFQASNIGKRYTKKLFRSTCSSIILATLILW